MPTYKSEIVSLIKATAIVGYIAVQDLTKIADLIRSRTYEAFFPLIVVTILYFALAALLNAIVKRIDLKLDPRKRTPEQILKGVKTE
jgi:polar amino acid transport system substrate-binding protein